MEKQAAPPTQMTYIQADVATFKDLVQKLTGGSPHKLRPKAALHRKSPFKLRDRRKHSVRDLEIISAGNCSPARTIGQLSDSPVDGPGTPIGCESAVIRNESPASEEERAIAENGFYLHMSPAKAEPPVLLALFPLTSRNKEF
ncbi:VQ motif-containing protein 31-like [Andrographis paniculata]|uniref:VQ motif-containing protein 31-like n=1 Tax=Andrographis paniculata TaxID=175694 RepID=UPI0021E95EE1|nr:VQ motif-containing protein 31-like [Andrographis paniculata]